MKRLTITVHRAHSTDVHLPDDFDAQARRQLDARASHESRTVSVCATEGADAALFSGDPYILVESGLVTNTPMLPVINFDLLDTDQPLPGDRVRAAEAAQIARGFGLTDAAARLESFARAHRAPTLPGL